MQKVSVCGSKNFQNCRASYFYLRESTYNYAIRTKTELKYDARQSRHSKNTIMTNKCHISDPPTFSTVQFLVKLAVWKIPKTGYFLSSRCAKIVNVVPKSQSWIIKFTLEWSRSSRQMITLTSIPQRLLYTHDILLPRSGIER